MNSLHSPVSVRPPVPKLLVLGIGNTLMQDDGAGVHVIRELQSAQRDSRFLQSGVEIIDGGTLGYLLADRISEVDGMVVVDAANFGEAAGTVRVIADADIDRFLNNPSLSVHEVGLVDLLQMMALSGQGPRWRALVGIQPDEVGWGTEMSPAVAAAIPKAGQLVAQVLAEWVDRV